MIVKSLDVDKRALLRDVQIREHPLWLRERSAVRQLLSATRALDRPDALYAFNSVVLESVRGGEARLSSLGDYNGEVRKTIRAAADQSVRRTHSRVLDAVAYERDVVRALVSVVRTIADAAVWQLLEFDRAALALLGEGRAARRLASSIGLANELEELDDWSSPGFPDT
jgi:hypothetical protein